MWLSSFVANAMYMGGQEMRKVLERDNATIRRNLDKVRKRKRNSAEIVFVYSGNAVFSSLSFFLPALLQLVFYYGATDRWCPVQYYHDIKRDFPDGDFRLCENGFRHAFVLDAAEAVAKLVVEWTRGDLRT